MESTGTDGVPRRFVGNSVAAVTAVHLKLTQDVAESRVLLLRPDNDAAFAWAAGLPPDAEVSLAVLPDRASSGAWKAASAGEDLGILQPSAGDRAATRDGRERLRQLHAAGRLSIRTFDRGAQELAGRSTDRFFHRNRAGSRAGLTRERGADVEVASSRRERLYVFQDPEDVLHLDAFEDDLQEIMIAGQPRLEGKRPGAATSSPGMELRPYQADAVEGWVANGFRGLLAMATGTGKTVTAVEGVSRALESCQRGLVVVVLAPLVHLVDQWTDMLTRLPGRVTPCHTATARWQGAAATDIALVRAGQKELAVLVATHATGGLEAFRSLIDDVPDDQLMVVIDEAHHYVSAGFDELPTNASYRLGLTATPPDASSPEDSALLEYLGGVTAKYTLSDAIAQGVLCPYEYLTHPVQLTEDELERFHEVAGQLARLIVAPNGSRDRQRLDELVRARSAVLDEATGKLEVLARKLDAESPDRTIVYCSGRPQLEAVMSLCWDRGIGAHPFTGEERPAKRSQLLERFADGQIPALVAIRCLDEGVDVPAAREAYLLRSSGSRTQAVQRRGRLLRTHPGKDRAIIHDLVVRSGDRAVRQIESERVRTFAADARNGAEALRRYEQQEGASI